MLFGNETISTYTPRNVTIWMALAFQAGVLNVGGFLACHRFVSHVTGFATFFGIEVSKESYPTALGMLLVPSLFLCGAMASGQLVDIRLKLHQKPRYYIVFGILFFLSLVIVICGFNGVFGIFGEPIFSAREHILLALLCFICGMQNGMVTTVSNAVVRTTHLTGITTDLGIGMARVLNRKRFALAEQTTNQEVRANLMRTGIILFFGSGSVVGAILFKKVGYQGFLLPTVISGTLFGASMYFQIFRKKLN